MHHKNGKITVSSNFILRNGKKQTKDTAFNVGTSNVARSIEVDANELTL